MAFRTRDGMVSVCLVCDPGHLFRKPTEYSSYERRVMKAYWGEPSWQRYFVASDALVRAVAPLSRNMTERDLRSQIERLRNYMPEDELLSRIRRLPDVKGNLNLASVSKSVGCNQLRSRGVLLRNKDGIFITDKPARQELEPAVPPTEPSP